MKNAAAFTLSLLLIAPSAGTALAQNRGGGGGGHAAPAGHSAPASRPAPASHPAPAPHPAPQAKAQTPTKPSGGFALNNDVHASKPAPASHPSAPSKPASTSTSTSTSTTKSNVANTVNKSGGNTVVNKSGGNTVNNNINVNKNTNVNHNTNVVRSTNPAYAGRNVVVNPRYPPGPAYGWNHGSPWYPAPNYYGGGFWGAMAIGATSAAVSAAVYGSIVNSSTHTTYTSYQVQPNSPGATLLQNYNLQQTQCGPPGLVVVYGPSNSVICANPNSTVAAGEYDLDTEQLSLVSR